MDVYMFVGGVLMYITALVFVAGISYRLNNWLRSPQPTPWPLYPVKDRITAVAETLLMLPHYRAEKVLWVTAIAFHLCFLVSASLHLKDFLAGEVSAFEGAAFYLGAIAGTGAVATTLVFWARRFTIARVKVITALEDHFALAILLVTLALGTYLRLTHAVEPGDVQRYIFSLLSFSPQVPHNPAFLLHLFLGEIYLMYFPFSKPMHAFSSLINSFITTEVGRNA